MTGKMHRSLSRNQLKWIAMLAMTCNHIPQILGIPAGFAGTFMQYLGYFTAVTMCFLLVQGYDYTRSKKHYALRLGLFAILSQAPFAIAFSGQMRGWLIPMNMMYSLLICLLFLIAVHELSGKAVQIPAMAGCVLLSLVGDWPGMALLYTWLFDRAGRKKEQLVRAYFVCITAVFFNELITDVNLSQSFARAVCDSLLACGGILLSAVCVLYLYDEKRAVSEPKRADFRNKWVFYLYYPVHLIILSIIRTYV